MLSRFDRITRYFDEIGSLLSSLPLQPIDDVIDALLIAQRYGRTIYVMGNGGSASTASHFVCDLQKWTISAGQRRVRAVALTDNMPVFSAWSNDEGYEHAFEQQLRTLANPGDVVVAISGSGRSRNIVRAVRFAAAQGCVTVGFSGYEGGELLGLTDHCIVVPSERMNQIEDVHMALCHLIADVLLHAVAQAVEQPLIATPVRPLHAGAAAT